MTQPTQLRRILGLGFGLAFAFGTMIGVGILRLPGVVAAAAGDQTTVIVCWCIGGLYALMGAVSVSELAAMYPETGGMRIYPRRAFGERVGFIVGWADWLAIVATAAYAAVSAADFGTKLWPTAAGWERLVAVVVICAFGAMHAIGLRLGRSITAVASLAIGVLFLVLVVGCFLRAPVDSSASAAVVALPVARGFSIASVLLIVPAMRSIVTAYDGWYAPIYTAEECVDAAKTLPRAMIGGAALVTCLYVAINVALMRVLPLPVLAASTLPAADAARIVLPHGADTVMTVLSLVIVLSLVNGQALMGPRVLLSLAREGWIPSQFAQIGNGGTPQAALAVTMLAAGLLILTGSFAQIIDLFTVLAVLNYVFVFLSVFVLRYKAPDMLRPYQAWGYPLSTLVVLLGSLAFLAAAIAEDWRSGATAAIFLALCIPAYAFAARARQIPHSIVARVQEQ